MKKLKLIFFSFFNLSIFLTSNDKVYNLKIILELMNKIPKLKTEKRILHFTFYKISQPLARVLGIKPSIRIRMYILLQV